MSMMLYIIVLFFTDCSNVCRATVVYVAEEQTGTTADQKILPVLPELLMIVSIILLVCRTRVGIP